MPVKQRESAPVLISGPYERPHVQPGQELRDRRFGWLLVHDLTRAPIRWPATRRGNLLIPILTGDLVRAVRRESAAAVSHHWGVTRWTVTRWRRALGVSWFTPGTRELWRGLVSERLFPRGRLRNYRLDDRAGLRAARAAVAKLHRLITGGTTRANLARKLAVDERTIRRWVEGHGLPSIAHAKRIRSLR